MQTNFCLPAAIRFRKSDNLVIQNLVTNEIPAKFRKRMSSPLFAGSSWESVVFTPGKDFEIWGKNGSFSYLQQKLIGVC